MKRPKYFVLAIFLLFVPTVAAGISENAPSYSQASKNVSAIPSFQEIVDSIDMDRIGEHVRFFTSLPTRATGYTGNRLSAEYIYNRFVDCGLKNVSYHEFPVVVPLSHGANVTILPTGSMIEIHPILPNLVCPSTTPPGGITGKLIYGGMGRMEDFNGLEVKGNIVLLDWYAQAGWLNAAQLGAKAVIFISPLTFGVNLIPEGLLFGTQNPVRSSSRFLFNIPYNFPRFYADASSSILLMDAVSEDVRLVSTVRWEEVTGRNVLALTDASRRPEIIITSYYDTSSDAPTAAPGAQEALGISALLELARYLGQHPPKYSVLLIAFGGHHQALAGGYAFCYDYIMPAWNLTKRGFAQETAMAFNLDISSGTGMPFLTTAGAGGVAGAPSGADYMPISKYGETIAEALNAERPKGYGYNFYHAMIPRAYGAAESSWTLGESFPWRGPFPYDSEPFTTLERPVGSSLTTFQDIRPYYETPFDTYDKIDFANVRKQLEYDFSFLIRFVNDDVDALLQAFMPHSAAYSIAQVSGIIGEWDPTTNFYQPLSSVNNRPRALVQLSTGQLRNSYWTMRYTFTDEDGRFLFIGGLKALAASECWANWGVLSAFVIDDLTGNILYAPDLGQYKYSPDVIFLRGGAVNPLEGPYDIGVFTVFNASSIVLFDIMSPYSLGLPRDEVTQVVIPPLLAAYKADTHVALVSIYMLVSTPSIICVPPNTPVEFTLKFAGRRFPMALLTNFTETQPVSPGYSLKPGQQLVLSPTPLYYAQDLKNLNDERVQIIKATGLSLSKPTMDDVDKTKALIDMVFLTISQRHYDLASILSYQAWSTATGVYLNVRPSIEDAITVVPFLAAFLLPFSWLFEKLIFASSGVKRLVAFILIFGGVLATLYVLHPGFRLAASPIMIIIGFGTLVLTTPILVIVISKVLALIRSIRIKFLGRHEEEVERGGQITYPFLVGVENMRRARTRTSLTLVAVILMVTGIISITAISAISTTYKSQVAVGEMPYEGIYLHRYKWGRGSFGLPNQILTYFTANYKNEGTIVPRAWKYLGSGWSTTPNPGFRYSFHIHYGNKTVVAPTLWGLTPQESELTHPEVFLLAGRWFESWDQNVVILTRDQAEALGIGIENFTLYKVEFEGMPFTVIGVIDPAYGMFKDVDGEALTPIQFDWPVGENPFNVHNDMRYSFILTYEDVLRMDGSTASISFKTSDKALMDSIARDLIKEFPEFFVFTSSDGVTYLNSSKLTTTVLGWQFQIVPMVIVAFSLLDIMLGSVVERKRQIFTYSSVGLSPRQIGNMFLSEAVVYGVIGGVVGYLAGLVITVVANALVPGTLALNFTSQWVTLAMSLSILTVVLSSLYPIFVAGRLSTPSLERAWRIPTKPAGDLWDVPLPFHTASKYEAQGIMEFSKEFLSAHTATDAPEFSVKELGKIETVKDERGTRLVLKMFCRLHPYEKGVAQEVTLHSIQAEARWPFALTFKRREGSVDDWTKLNRVFVDLIRKQILLWRAMSPTEKEKYSEKGGKA